MKERFPGLDIPVFGPDPRQGFFYGVTGVLTENADKVLDVIQTSAGFPASYVNLGWLAEAIENQIMMGNITCERDINDLLCECVQRLKSMWHRKSHEYRGNTYDTIQIKTKDDRGWYVYEFTIRVPWEMEDEEDDG